MSMRYHGPASRTDIADKLPLNRQQSEDLIDQFLVPLMRRAGLSVKTRRMGSTRTLTVKLPK